MKIASRVLFLVTLSFAIAWLVFSLLDRGWFQKELSKAFSRALSSEGTEVSEKTSSRCRRRKKKWSNLWQFSQRTSRRR